MKLIYRKADGVIVGSVAPPQPESLEMQNILGSELGGSASDYGITRPVPARGRGQVYRVGANGAVEVVPSPTGAQREAARAAAHAKLRALGMSQAEVEAI